MRIVKWLLISFFALAVGGLVVGYIVLTSYPVADLKALIERQVEEATGHKLEIAGDVSLDVSLTPALVMGKVTLDAAAGEAPLARIERLEVSLALIPLLSDEVAIERLLLVSPQIALARDAQGRGNWDSGSAQTAGGGDSLAFVFKDVEVRDGQLVYQAAPTTSPRRLEISSLQAGSSGPQQPLSGTLSGKADQVPFDLVFNLGSLEQMAADQGFPVSLAGTIAGAEISLEAQHKQGAQVVGEVKLSAKDLASFSALAGQYLPAVGPLSLDAKVNGSAGELQLQDLVLSLAGSDLKGEVTLQESDAGYRLDGSLRGERLRLDQILATTAGEGTPDQRLIPDLPLPLDALTALDGKLDVTLARLDLPGGTSLTDLSAQALLAGGELTVNPVTFGLFEGKVEGNLDLKASQQPPAITLSAKVAGLNYGALLDRQVSGHLNGEINVSGAGADLRSLVKNLTGTTQVDSRDTVLQERALALIDASLLTLLGPIFGGSDQVALTCAISRVEWRNGSLVSQATAVAGAGFLTTASGSVDLLGERMDLYLQTAPRGIGLSAVTPPLRLSGPLSDPSVYPDPQGTAIKAATTAGMVMLPPLLVVKLISAEAKGLEDDHAACQTAVSAIEKGGGTEAVVGRWLAAGGSAVTGILSGAGDAAVGVGKTVGEAAGSVGSAVGEGLDAVGTGASDAVQGIRGLFD
ncbi:MAG: AsmA family protein [Pseudomonadota bacterium]